MSKTFKTLFVASDHAGLAMKRHLLARFPQYNWKYLGAHNDDSVDYPDYAAKLCSAFKEELEVSRGILVCGSGQGMAIGANRFPFIRAALCWNEDIARLSRSHNNANVLCLAGNHTVFPV